MLWKEVGKACQWKHPRAPTVRLLFQDERATPAVLSFLRDTKVGRITSREVPAGVEWEELDEGIELWPAEDVGRDEEGGEGGPGPPWAKVSFPLFLLWCALKIVRLAEMGRKRRGSPTWTAAAGRRWEKRNM